MAPCIVAIAGVPIKAGEFKFALAGDGWILRYLERVLSRLYIGWVCVIRIE